MENVPRVSFAKYEGLANDFVVIDGAHHWVCAEAAARMCDRRLGIGADGVLTLLPPRHPEAAVRMHVFNADGTVAEMCGNGLRCIVRHHLEGLGRHHVVVDTDAGLREGWLQSDGQVRVSMGEAVLIEDSVRAPVDDTEFRATAVSLGNPHLVLAPFAAGIDLRALAERYGASLERHPSFPERVNVGFASLEGARVKLVVFERGSGITQACGTGAAAAAAVVLRDGLVSAGPVWVDLPGGPLSVTVEGRPTEDSGPGASLGQVTITGGARHVFDGEIELAASELQAPGYRV